MLDKIKNRKESGFTIVEVMIVLAIAGLVILIVFLAVPALQRNSRNTQAKNEASSVVGAVNELIANNNGKLPAVSTSATGGSDAAKILGNTKLQNVTTIAVVAQAATVTVPSATSITVIRGGKCVAPMVQGFAGNNTIQTAGTARQFAVLYPMEDSAGNATGCIDS